MMPSSSSSLSLSSSSKTFNTFNFDYHDLYDDDDDDNDVINITSSSKQSVDCSHSHTTAGIPCRRTMNATKSDPHFIHQLLFERKSHELQRRRNILNRNNQRQQTRITHASIARERVVLLNVESTMVAHESAIARNKALLENVERVHKRALALQGKEALSRKSMGHHRNSRCNSGLEIAKKRYMNWFKSMYPTWRRLIDESYEKDLARINSKIASVDMNSHMAKNLYERSHHLQEQLKERKNVLRLTSLKAEKEEFERRLLIAQDEERYEETLASFQKESESARRCWLNSQKSIESAGADKSLEVERSKHLISAINMEYSPAKTATETTVSSGSPRRISVSSDLFTTLNQTKPPVSSPSRMDYTNADAVGGVDTPVGLKFGGELSTDAERSFYSSLAKQVYGEQQTKSTTNVKGKFDDEVRTKCHRNIKDPTSMTHVTSPALSCSSLVTEEQPPPLVYLTDDMAENREEPLNEKVEHQREEIERVTVFPISIEYEENPMQLQLNCNEGKPYDDTTDHISISSDSRISSTAKTASLSELVDEDTSNQKVNKSDVSSPLSMRYTSSLNASDASLLLSLQKLWRAVESGFLSSDVDGIGTEIFGYVVSDALMEEIVNTMTDGDSLDIFDIGALEETAITKLQGYGGLLPKSFIVSSITTPSDHSTPSLNDALGVMGDTQRILFNELLIHLAHLVIKGVFSSHRAAEWCASRTLVPRRELSPKQVAWACSNAPRLLDATITEYITANAINTHVSLSNCDAYFSPSSTLSHTGDSESKLSVSPHNNNPAVHRRNTAGLRILTREASLGITPMSSSDQTVCCGRSSIGNLVSVSKNNFTQSLRSPSESNLSLNSQPKEMYEEKEETELDDWSAGPHDVGEMKLKRQMTFDDSTLLSSQLLNSDSTVPPRSASTPTMIGTRNYYDSSDDDGDDSDNDFIDHRSVDTKISTSFQTSMIPPATGNEFSSSESLSRSSVYSKEAVSYLEERGRIPSSPGTTNRIDEVETTSVPFVESLLSVDKTSSMDKAIVLSSSKTSPSSLSSASSAPSSLPLIDTTVIASDKLQTPLSNSTASITAGLTTATTITSSISKNIADVEDIYASAFDVAFGGQRIIIDDDDDEFDF